MVLQIPAVEAVEAGTITLQIHLLRAQAVLVL
jgi:hypothetical protein